MRKYNLTAELLDLLQLHVGIDNAIHMGELAERLNVSEDTIKRNIKRLRRTEEGADIVSGSAGYWIATSPQEIEQMHRALTKQALTRLQTARSIARSTAEDREVKRAFFEQLQRREETETKKDQVGNTEREGE